MAMEENGQDGQAQKKNESSALKDKLVGMRSKWMSGTPEQAKRANFHAMSRLARDVSRKILTRVASEMIERAFDEGKWVAASDASLHQRDGTSISWAIFNPGRQLVAAGSERLSEEFGFVPAQAEAAASIRCAQELARLKAESALCVSDCVPSITALVGAGSEPSIARAEWDAASQGRYGLSWVPREALGPANDAAREILGLAAEAGQRRGWGGWLEELKSSDAGWEEMLRGPRGIIDEDGSSFQVHATPGKAIKAAMAEDKWIAVADWAFTNDGLHAGISVGLFNSQGELKVEHLMSTALSVAYDEMAARKRCAVFAGKCLARHHAEGGVCLVSLGDKGVRWDTAREPELPEGITVALCPRKYLATATVVAKIAASKAYYATGPDLNIWNVGDKILTSRRSAWSQWMESVESIPEPEPAASIPAEVVMSESVGQRIQGRAAPASLARESARPVAAKKSGPEDHEALRAALGGRDGTAAEVIELAAGKKWMMLAEPCFGGAGGRVGLACVLFDERGELRANISTSFRPEKASLKPVDQEAAIAAVRVYCLQRLSVWGRLDAALSIGSGVASPKISERGDLAHDARAEGHWFTANPGQKTGNDAAVAATGILQAQAATKIATTQMSRSEPVLPDVWEPAQWQSWMAVVQKGAVAEIAPPAVQMGRLAATRAAMAAAKAARSAPSGSKP